MSVLKRVWSWGKDAVGTAVKGVGSVLSPGTIERIKKDSIDYATGKTNETLDRVGLGGAVQVKPVYYDQYKPLMYIGGGLLLLFLLFSRK